MLNKFFNKGKKDSVKENGPIKDQNTDNDSDDDEISLGSEASPSIFETNKKNIKDVIKSEGVDFSQDPRWFIDGDYYGKNFYIGLLPNSVNFVSFLYNLYNCGDIDTSVFINPIPNEQTKEQLGKLRTNLMVEAMGSKGDMNRGDDMATKSYEADAWRQEIRDGTNKFYDVSIIATLFNKDKRNLDNETDMLKEKLGQNDVGLKNGIFIQEALYKSNKPLCDNTVGEGHIFDKRSLGCTFPFVTNNLMHKNGTVIGFNVDNGLPIFYDNFDESLNNYNMFIFAPSGSGKSTLLKEIAGRTSIIDSVQNVAIDIAPEYRLIAEKVGGITYDISNDSNTIINIFDVEPEYVEDQITKQVKEEIVISNKINDTTDVIMSLARGFIAENNQYYNNFLRSIILEVVTKEFNKLHITKDPNSLYEVQELGLGGKGGKSKKKMPTLSSWYKQLEEDAKNNMDDTLKVYYTYLLKCMKTFINGMNESTLTCFDGQTTFEISKDIPFINFDLSKLNSNTQLPLAQYIITNFIWNKLIKRNLKKPTDAKAHKIRLIIDEAWRMTRSDESMKFMIELWRTARKYNTSAVAITQQYRDFFTDQTEAIIKNSDTRFFLKPKNEEVADIKTVFQLKEGEAEYLRSCAPRGYALMHSNNFRCKLFIDLPAFEREFIETNQNRK